MSAYCTQAQLTVPTGTLEDLSSEDLDAAIASASSMADSYLGQVFDLPLTAWGEDVRRAVAQIATYYAMQKRGFNPDSDDGAAIRLGYTDAMKWLEAIGQGKALPTGVMDSSSGAENATPYTGPSDYILTGRGSSQVERTFWDRDPVVAVTPGTLGPPKDRGW